MSNLKLVYRDIPVEGFERVIECTDADSGLHAIIAIHDTRLGPALGGVRIYPYASFDQALTDVTRLAKGMSYKAAVSEVGTGGGKAVIILEKGKEKTPALFHAFAEAVNHLKGRYICAEDYGVTQEDLDLIAQKTRYIVGFAKTSGNPSPFTVWGGYRGIQAVCQTLWGTPSVAGKTVAIQGLGATGMRLAQLLFWEGAELIVSDIDSLKVKRAAHDFSAKGVTSEALLSTECDILVPCALGGIFHEKSIPQLRCEAIAGLANNQLLTPEDGRRIHDRGILYAPDYVINAGGLLNVCQEIRQEGYNARAARDTVHQLYTILIKIFKVAKEKGVPTSQIANEIAEYNLDAGIGRRAQEPVFHQ